MVVTGELRRLHRCAACRPVRYWVSIRGAVLPVGMPLRHQPNAVGSPGSREHFFMILIARTSRSAPAWMLGQCLNQPRKVRVLPIPCL